MQRRQFLQGAVAAMLGQRVVSAQGGPRRFNEKLVLVLAGDSNVLAFNSGDGLVLVDTGAAQAREQVVAALKDFAASTTVKTVFNTHYHLDQTGNNEMFAASGAKIIAHERTRQWMAADYWVPAEDRYQKARLLAARPSETFLSNGTLQIPGEQIDYGYLPLAHTSGDIYVFFKNANVLAVGEVASPVRDPAFDFFTGAWIGGRVDAMDLLLGLSNADTQIVPAYGPVMTRAALKAERDMMEEVRGRLFKTVREGDGPDEMLEAGVLKGLARTWKDPHKFLYDAAKGLWAHHSKLDHNVV